jgi:hypothetical protein
MKKVEPNNKQNRLAEALRANLRRRKQGPPTDLPLANEQAAPSESDD